MYIDHHLSELSKKGKGFFLWNAVYTEMVYLSADSHPSKR